MSQRERPHIEAGSDTVPRSPGGGQANSRSPAARNTVANPIVDWEELFQNAPPAEQAKFLSLISPTGILPAHHLPANPSQVDRPRQFLNQLFAARGNEWPVLRPTPADLKDAALDEKQRRAVAAAVETSDVCLIQGLPGTGKSRVVHEIIVQAVRRGERLLLVAPGAVVDRTLAQIGADDAVYCVRSLATGEQADTLPPAVRPFTFAERTRRLTHDAVASASELAERAARHLETLRPTETVWPKARAILSDRDALETRAADLAQQAARLTEVVDQEATEGTWGPEIATAKAQCEAVRQRVETGLAEVRRKQAERRQAIEALTPQMESLRPLAEAKQHGSWWTKTFWQATLSGDVLAQLNELQSQQDQARKAIDDLELDAARLSAEQAEAEELYRSERARLCAAEVARRQELMRQEQESLEPRRGELTAQWETCFAATTPRPSAMLTAALQECQEAWQRSVDEAADEARKTRDWADALSQAIPTVPARIATHVNLVAGPLAAVLNDPQFNATPFDRLIVEEADELTEADFVALARRARSWVLVAGTESAHPIVESPKINGPRRGNGDARPGTVRTAPRFFHRLWDRLHANPSRLQSAWLHDEGRWCCRLRPVADEQRRWVESERVADRNDIELRILALPRAEPVLAEVIFPESMTLAEAKAYIFTELQALPLQARNGSLEWADEPGRTVLSLGGNCVGPEITIPLADGACERAAGPIRGHRGEPAVGLTLALEFDHAAGWDRTRAEQWVGEHLDLRDLGRTFFLNVPHRTEPRLARFLSDLLFDGAYRVSGTNDCSDSFEFVPVPAVNPGSDGGDHDNARRGNGSRPSRGGAGFELDLADGRHRDRLPSELRPTLPERGLVNYLEAQAVVRYLERLAAEVETGERPTVALISPYAAQVELLRQMTAQSSGLASSRLNVSIELPCDCVGRDFDIVLCSLTRSHNHRAVTFADGPSVLALAMTRARRRLIVFGDPGTMQRRCQWEGTLDHLDEAAGYRERAIIAGLVRHAPAPPVRPRPLAVSEGRRT